MIRLPLSRLQSQYFFSALIILLLGACGLDPAHDPRNVLSDSIRWYNAKFEGKLMDTAIVYVNPQFRPDFTLKAQDIKDKVSFYDSAIVDIQFYKGDEPAQMNDKEDSKNFDRAVVLMRYRLSVLPSNTLKNIVIEQEWNKIGKGWFVAPDLTEFITKEEPPKPDPED